MDAMTGDITIGKHLEIKPSDAEKMFKQLIAYGVGTCGVNTAPDAITIGNLNEYVFGQLKNYTFEEVQRAIYFNATGEFQTKVKPYNLFDVNFLSDVMTEWLILKNQTRNRIAALLPKPKEPELETHEQRYQGLLNYINLNQKFPEFWAWEAVFKHMEDVGVINESLISKRLLFNEIKVKLEVKQEMDLMNVADFIERERITSGLTDRVIAECRKITVQKYLSHLITT